MPIVSPRPFSKSLVLLLGLLLSLNTITFAQSRPQKGEPPKSGGKKISVPLRKPKPRLKPKKSGANKTKKTATPRLTKKF